MKSKTKKPALSKKKSLSKKHHTNNRTSKVKVHTQHVSSTLPVCRRAGSCKKRSLVRKMNSRSTRRGGGGGSGRYDSTSTGEHRDQTSRSRPSSPPTPDRHDGTLGFGSSSSSSSSSSSLGDNVMDHRGTTRHGHIMDTGVKMRFGPTPRSLSDPLQAWAERRKALETPKPPPSPPPSTMRATSRAGVSPNILRRTFRDPVDGREYKVNPNNYKAYNPNLRPSRYPNMSNSKLGIYTAAYMQQRLHNQTGRAEKREEGDDTSRRTMRIRREWNDFLPGTARVKK